MSYSWLFGSQFGLILTCTVILCLQDERAKMTERIQNAGTEVVEAKAGAVSINTG